jgi:hypothetical protein
VFKGKLTVTGSGGTNSNASAKGGSMSWCNGPNTGATVTSNTAGTVNVQVDPAPSGAPCNAVKLPSNAYDIRWVVGTWDAGTQTGADCMATTDIGNINVNSNGTGSATSNSFNPGGAGTISVCVADASGINGNQVPVSVV